MSIMYYYVDGDEKAGNREGKVGAVHTNPCGVARVHHHFSNPPAAPRRNGCAFCSGLRPETHIIFGDMTCQDQREHAT